MIGDLLLVSLNIAVLLLAGIVGVIASVWLAMNHPGLGLFFLILLSLLGLGLVLKAWGV